MTTNQPKSHARVTLGALAAVLLAAFFAVPSQAQESKLNGFEPAQSSIQGVVTAIGLEGQSTPLEGIALKLSGDHLEAQSLSTLTDAEGHYEFTQLGAGTYSLQASPEGFIPFAKSVVLKQNEAQTENVALQLATMSFKVDVQAQAPTVSERSADPDATITSRQFLALPLVEQKFKEALPVVPGVVRTLDGKLNIKGEVENQGMLLVDSAQMVDPVTGSLAIAIPTDAIQTLNVFKTPYNAQYGGFSGGLTTIETKPPSNRWNFHVTDFVPGLRGKGGHIAGISSETPQLVFGGPILKDKLNFSEAFDYTLRKRAVRGLAWPDNEIKTQGFNSFTTFQAILSPTHLLTTNVDVFPMRTQFANINTLVPQSASSNYGQKGVSIGVNDSYQFNSGALLSTVFRYTRFESNAYGQGSENMLVTPEEWGGNFFSAWTRTANQFEALPIFQLPPKAWHGSHQLRVGANVTRRSYNGNSHSHPIHLLREDGSLAQRIDFREPGLLDGKDTEVSEFVQDHWSVNDHLALDFGARLSSQSIGRSAAVAPRAGLAYSPGSSQKTIIRAGAGLFYDRVPLLAATFTQNPERVVSFFDQTGSIVGTPVALPNAYVGAPGSGVINTGRDLGMSPRNFTWNLGVERELPRNVMLRLSYVQSQTRRLFVTDPLLDAVGNNSVLGLRNTGSSHYREFEATVRFRPIERSQLSVSYVRSRARGDLNTLSGTFVPFEQPVIRPNFTGSLKSDIPNRLVSSGIFQLPWKLTFSPVVDLHTGFPYSEVDVLQNYVGQPNSRRFPTFFSLDIKVYREFHLPFALIGWKKSRKFRIGFYSINVTNHSNPRDVFNNVTSRNFGEFAGFQHRVNGLVVDVVN
jgi:Carboxypeptidase regulatory-like domain